METAPSTGKLAFPRWHERHLFQALAWFTTLRTGKTPATPALTPCMPPTGYCAWPDIRA
ncbi:MAG: hypothetical protein OXC08_20500 [Thiotrichales bacterium]|nr:hypothetical protein [Thiotrichales bacterium]